MNSEKPKKFYGSINFPASVGEHKGFILGIFYRGGIRHIAKYIPYSDAVREALCRRIAGVPTRSIDNLCPDCVAEAKKLVGTLVFK